MTAVMEDVLLMAYLDDRLSSAQREEVERLMRVTPALRERADQLMTSVHACSQAFAGQALAPIPERLQRSVDEMIARHRLGAIPGTPARPPEDV